MTDIASENGDNADTFSNPVSHVLRDSKQRGGSRPVTILQQGFAEDGSLDGGSVRQSVNSNITIPQRIASEDADQPAPPSRGTEVTELGTVDRGTANTSPTHGHAAGSFTDSVRPLQNGPANAKGLSLNLDKGYKNGTSTPKSPRSFHSNFLMPTRNDGPAGSPSPSRSNQGREKLSSAASSPGFTPANVQQKDMQTPNLCPVPLASCFPSGPHLYAYIFYICMSSFIHASVSDPGILPRNLHPMPLPDEDEDPLRLGPPQNDWTMIKSAQSTTAAMEVPTKYCKTCNIWRPPRGHHLSHKLLSMGISSIFHFGASLSHWRIPFAMFIYGLLATPYPGALMAYHFFLMGRGETTREYLNSHKFIKKDRHRPFNQGSFISNWIAVLCRPRPPTYLSFKRKYEEGDQRFGERREKRTAPLTKEFQGGENAMELQNVHTAEGGGFQGPTSLRPAT
ncbi:hypothetical protein DID88_007067 [Monilinia fructigena]|uniref:protein S-acyltransferase n=1 Tax=Monilinia fructigena TaxID=38457 RepID=A0A395J776_9HELO|nr:hypothetical protein DID88_007067 [Monilinia fructigena]